MEFNLVISGGLGLQWLDTALQFLDRDWGTVMALRALNPSHWTSGQWEGPGLLSLQKRIPTKTEVMKELKCFLGGKGIPVDRHRWAQRESCWVTPSWQFKLIYGAFLSVFLWPIILICLVLRPHLVFIRNLPYVHIHLLAKMDFIVKKLRGNCHQVIWSDTPPFLTSNETFCAHVVVFLTP